MTFNSGLKGHNIMNENILNPINNCPSLINTAFEIYESVDIFGEYIIETYISNNKKRQRTVIYKDGKAVSACYYESESGFIIYGYTDIKHRQHGIYKQLKAYIYLKHKVRLWSQFQSEEYIQAFG